MDPAGHASHGSLPSRSSSVWQGSAIRTRPGDDRAISRISGHSCSRQVYEAARQLHHAPVRTRSGFSATPMTRCNPYAGVVRPYARTQGR
jgi:hypothetical protein